MARVSAAISWLLVRLIGRALGLVFKGVKQSLAPQRQNQNKDDHKNAQTDAESFVGWMPNFT